MNRRTWLYLSTAIGAVLVWHQFIRGTGRLTETDVRELLDRVDASHREGYRHVDCSLRTRNFVLNEQSRDLSESEASGFEVVTQFEASFDAETDALGANSLGKRTLSREDFCRSGGPSQWALDHTELRRTHLEITVDADGQKAHYKAHYIQISPPVDPRKLEISPDSSLYRVTDEFGVVAIEDRNPLIESQRRLIRDYWLRENSAPDLSTG